MKVIVAAFGFLFLAVSVEAQPLRCFQQVAFGKPTFFDVDSKVGEKIPVAKADGHRVYLSEKEPNTFELEAFIVENEIRIYSKASLKVNTDIVELSYWSRDQVLQWTCSLN